MVTSFVQYNDVTDRRAVDVRLFVFYHPLGLVGETGVSSAPFYKTYNFRKTLPSWSAKSIYLSKAQ